MEHLGLFAKYWTPGTVKTRLAAQVGDASASDLHLAFLTASLGRFASLGRQRWLAFAPAERRGDFELIAGDAWQLTPQGDGDLGRRMQHFFEERFAAGALRVVVVGSDSPTLPTAYIEQAFERLASCRVVLGPADDGGYYLLGMSLDEMCSDALPSIFEAIDWGSDQVWRQTVARLQAAGIQFSTLPKWYDVDTYADLLRLKTELYQQGNDKLASLRTAVEAAILP